MRSRVIAAVAVAATSWALAGPAPAAPVSTTAGVAAAAPSSAVQAAVVGRAPKARARIEAVPGKKRLVLNVNPNLRGKNSWRVRIERLSGGEWKPVCTCRTKGRAEKVKKRVAAGTYRVRVLKKKGYRTSNAVIRVDFKPGAVKVEAPQASSVPVPASQASSVPVPVSQASSVPAPAPQLRTISSLAPLWVGDFESGDLSQFASTSWNNVPLAPQVSSVARSGRYAGQYTIPAGGSRSENVPKANIVFREGDDLWFSVSTQLASGVPLNTSEWQVFMQWKNDGEGSPPLALYMNSGSWRLGGGWGWPGTNTPTTPKQSEVNLGSAVAGAWDDWLIHIRFSSDPAKGTVDVWRNGTQSVSGWKPIGGTLYPGLNSYWKMGYYRSSAINQDSTVRLDDIRLGTSQTTVTG